MAQQGEGSGTRQAVVTFMGNRLSFTAWAAGRASPKAARARTGFAGHGLWRQRRGETPHACGWLSTSAAPVMPPLTRKAGEEMDGWRPDAPVQGWAGGLLAPPGRDGPQGAGARLRQGNSLSAEPPLPCHRKPCRGGGGGVTNVHKAWVGQADGVNHGKGAAKDRCSLG